jgi:hypothetical protein
MVVFFMSHRPLNLCHLAVTGNHLNSSYVSGISCTPKGFKVLRFKIHNKQICGWCATAKSRLLPCHGRSTLGAFLFITGAAHLMGGSFTTVGANAISAGPCPKTTSSPLSTASASAHASACSRSLASRTCSVSSRHFAYLLSNWFNGKKSRLVHISRPCGRFCQIFRYFLPIQAKNFSSHLSFPNDISHAVSSYSRRGLPGAFLQRERRSAGPPWADRQGYRGSFRP